MEVAIDPAFHVEVLFLQPGSLQKRQGEQVRQVLPWKGAGKQEGAEELQEPHGWDDPLPVVKHLHSQNPAVVTLVLFSSCLMHGYLV